MTTIREQTQCRFCREKKAYIDYKDIDTLQKLLTNRGKIFFASAAAIVQVVSGRSIRQSSGRGLWRCCRLRPDHHGASGRLCRRRNILIKNHWTCGEAGVKI